MCRDGRQYDMVSLRPVQQREVFYVEVLRTAGRPLRVCHRYCGRVVLIQTHSVVWFYSELGQDGAKVEAEFARFARGNKIAF